MNSYDFFFFLQNRDYITENFWEKNNFYLAVALKPLNWAPFCCKCSFGDTWKIFWTAGKNSDYHYTVSQWCEYSGLFSLWLFMAYLQYNHTKSGYNMALFFFFFLVKIKSTIISLFTVAPPKELQNFQALGKDDLFSKAFITEGEKRRKVSRKNNRQPIYNFCTLPIAILLATWQKKWNYKGDLIVNRREIWQWGEGLFYSVWLSSDQAVDTHMRTVQRNILISPSIPGSGTMLWD